MLLKKDHITTRAYKLQPQVHKGVSPRNLFVKRIQTLSDVLPAQKGEKKVYIKTYYVILSTYCTAMFQREISLVYCTVQNKTNKIQYNLFGSIFLL